jgi:gamma-glutamyltranspeptidase/glutathione hydrolase
MAAFDRGGNAIDAAVAAMMVLCVTMPASTGFGGYGGTMALYDAKSAKPIALDFDSRAPLAYKPELYANPAVAQHGYLAAGVPGNVAGYARALKQFGRLKWRDVCGPAVDAAENGFVLRNPLATSLANWAKGADPASLKAIFPDGTVPKVGERFRNPDLARLIRQLADADDPAAAFYRGDPAKTIVAQVRANGGILSEEDFARYEPQVSAPLHIRYRDLDLYTPAPPAGGITALAILKTLEHFDLPTFEHWGAPYYELLAEACKLCWQERAATLGDPDFVKVPAEEMLSAKAAARRADVIRFGEALHDHPSTRPVALPSGEHTCNVVAIDADRNVVSLTSTHGDGFGSHVAIGGLGLFLGHGMSRFTYASPAGPNAPQPGKRMDHNMSPVIGLRDGKPRLAVGMPGGTKIVTVTAQLLVSVIDFAAAPSAAVAAPRLHVETAEPLLVTSTMPREVVGELQLMGHQVKVSPAGLGGAANVALIATGGVLSAATSVGPAGIGGR